jgi:hypothetical protein
MIADEWYDLEGPRRGLGFSASSLVSAPASELPVNDAELSQAATL